MLSRALLVALAFGTRASNPDVKSSMGEYTCNGTTGETQENQVEVNLLQVSLQATFSNLMLVDRDVNAQIRTGDRKTAAKHRHALAQSPLSQLWHSVLQSNFSNQALMNRNVDASGQLVDRKTEANQHRQPSLHEVFEGSRLVQDIRSMQDFIASQAEYELHSETGPQSKVLLVLVELFFLGFIGCDRCCMGQVCCGFIKCCTCGACGIWTLLDYVVVVVNCLLLAESLTFLGWNVSFTHDDAVTAFWICITSFAFLICCGACFANTMSRVMFVLMSGDVDLMKAELLHRSSDVD